MVWHARLHGRLGGGAQSADTAQPGNQKQGDHRDREAEIGKFERQAECCLFLQLRETESQVPMVINQTEGPTVVEFRQAARAEFDERTRAYNIDPDRCGRHAKLAPAHEIHLHSRVDAKIGGACKFRKTASPRL
jgi:hypothetical protein